MTERTRDELHLALTYIADEVHRCAECAARRDVALSEDDGLVADACLEAMLVHARAVLDFLLNDSRFPTDIRRSTFPGPDWDRPTSELATSLRDDITVVNKHLAHLTWERIDPTQEPWEETGFAAKVVELADEWTDHLAKTDSALAQVMRPWLLYSRQALHSSPPSQGE